MRTFDANVAVQRGGDERAHHCEDVARRLEIVFRDAQIAGVDDILPLIAVHEEAVEHIDKVDEELRIPHALIAVG